MSSNTTIWTREFISLSAVNFLQYVSQYMLITGLPIYIMTELGGGEVEAGLVMTCFQIGTIVSRPIAGRIIDALDKRKVLHFAIVVFAVLMSLFLLADRVEAVYAIRLIHGAQFALGTTVAATLATLVLPSEKKGTGIGYFALTTNLAMVVGPLIGLTLIQQFGAQGFFYFLTGDALLALLLVFLPRMSDDICLPAVRKVATHEKRDVPKRGIVEMRAVPMALLGGITFFAYGGMLVFIPLYARALNMPEVVSMFFLVFALVIVVTRPVIGAVFDRKGADYTIYPGFFCYFVGFLIFANATTYLLMIVSAATIGIGFGAISPALQTLAVRSVPPKRAGMATATYFWALDISVGLASALLGAVALHLGYGVLYGIVSPIAIVFGLILYTYLRKRPTQHI